MHTPLLSSGSGRTRALRRWAGGLLALALPILAAPATQAQSIANYAFTQSSGTFTALTGGTVATVATTDDDVTAVLPIGFTYVYNGMAYTTFSASTNGFIGLGGQVSANAGNNLSTGTGVRPFIAPLWDDLDISSTSNISYLTSGTAGSRVLTVEWLNVKWRYTATAAGISFQAKLYEADGHVEFVYRQETGALATPTASIGITAVGTGSGNFLSLSDATAATTVSSTTETTGIATKPATGQVYAFTPAVAAVTAPSTLVFSAVGTSGGTVTFTDNSTNEFNFAVTITPTAGGPSTTTIVPSTTTAGTGTTYTTTFTGLSANTGYTVQVLSLGQARASTSATGTFSTTAGATLSGVYYVGTGTSPQPTRTYTTLTAAAAAYTTGTLTGAVTFLLLDNAYGTAETFPITFGANTSASATNTLTIKPNVGVSNATITAPATVVAPSTGGGIFVLNGSDYVIIDGSNTAGGTTRNLTLTTSSTVGVAAIQLISLGTGAGATNDVIRNVNITGPSSNAGVGIVVGGAALGTTGADNDNLTIQNNNITSSYSGVFVLGTAAVSAGGTDGLVITGNTLGATASGTANLGNIGFLINNAVSPSMTLNTIQNLSGAGAPAAFNMTGVTGATINQNTIQNISSTGGISSGIVLAAGSTGATISQNLIQNVGSSSSNSFGISLAAVGATITRNRILNIFSSSTGGYGGKGIDVATGSATSNVVIANNFIQITASSGYTFSSDANIGIRLGTGSALGGVNVYYNSVNMTGTDIFNIASQSAAIYVGSLTTALDIRNNIFRNSIVSSGNTGAKAYAIYSAAPNTAFTQLNYNDYFVSGTQGVLGYLGADATTLAALQTATGKDANSLNVDPQFISTTDLHTNAAALNNVGTPITGITVDIDGDTRSTTTPDIGADEFTPVAIDIAAAGLIAPAAPGTTGTCFGAAEAVTVSIRNSGASALNFATTPATITVVVTGPTGVATQTLTYVLSTGTLASGAILNVPLTGTGTTVNLSTAGTYSFAITATVAGDGNTANNTLTPSPTITVSAPVAGTLSAGTPSICNSGTTALTLNGVLNGSIQLQSSTSATGPFTNITGATSATFTTPVLTTTTYYRAQVTCGTTVVTSNVVTVTVSNPQLTATTPITTCAGQTATLTATSAAGTTVRFFTAATGGTALTGATTSGTTTVTTSQVTPVVTANTTFYAEASTGSSEVVGLTAPGASGTVTGTANIPSGLQFNTTGATTFTSAVIYPVGTGTVVVSILNSATGTEVAATAPIPVTGTGLATPVTIPINLSLPAAVTGYVIQIKAITGLTGLVRDNPLPAGVTYPFPTSPGGFTITSGINVGSTIAAYYFLYNITLGSACTGATRTPIQVNVNPAANATFGFGTATSFCTSQTTAQAVVLATGATAGTFTSTTGLTISATTGAITPSTSTPGTYTVTNTVAASGSVCAGTATSTVTITAPATAGFSYGTGTVNLCTSATATSPTLATGATAGTFTSATGLTISAAGVITPSTSTPGTYTVTNTVAASGGCAAATSTAQVTIVGAPTVPTLAAPSATSTTFCQGGSVVLTAPAGTGNTYQFFNSGTSLGAASATNTVTATAGGSYTVQVTNAGGCSATSTAIAVTVNPLPATPTVVLSGTPATGQTITASSSTTGVTYQFYRNNVLVTGTTGNTYFVNSGTRNGTYTVVAVSAQGCSSAVSASVTVAVTATTASANAASVRLYPNPTPNGLVSVELSGYAKPATFVVLNALGQVVQTLPAVLNGTTAIDLHELASGVYLLQVQANGQANQSLRFVKQ